MTEQDQYAFPGDRYTQGGIKSGHGQGMTLRDWFAGQALAGVVGGYWANPEMSGMNPSELVDEALRLANAMLEARK